MPSLLLMPQPEKNKNCTTVTLSAFNTKTNYKNQLKHCHCKKNTLPLQKKPVLTTVTDIAQ